MIQSLASTPRCAACPPNATMAQVKALQGDFAGIMLGKPHADFPDLYNSDYKINGVGITKVDSSFALDVMSETKDGRDAAIKQILAQPGARPLPNGKPIGGLGDGDKVLLLPYKGTPIPVVVMYTGRIVAQ